MLGMYESRLKESDLDRLEDLIDQVRSKGGAGQ
jgi:hypothetical protein